MIILCLLIFSYYFFYSIKNLHKAIIIFAPFSIICQGYMCLKYSSPAIILSFAIEFVFVAFSILKKGIRISSCPLLKPLIFMSIVHVIGIIVSPLPIIQTLPNVVVSIVSYLFLILFYNELKTSNDILISLKTLIVVTIILLLYSLVEYCLQTNPFLKYVIGTIPYEFLDGKLYYVEGLSRFFSIRCQSIFAICISWGGFCAMMVGVLFYIKDFVTLFDRRGFLWLLVVILSFCVLCTGTRSAFVYLGICFIGGASVLSKKTKADLVFLSICLILFYSVSSLNLNPSFDASEEGGSSVEMRTSQLNAVVGVIKNSPLFGLGVNGYAAAFKANSDIIGAESIWLQILISSGVFGVVCQIYMYIFSYKYLAKRAIPQKRFICLMFVLGWVVFSTLTSSPGLGDYYYLVIIVILGKLATLQNKSIKEKLLIFN